MPNKKSYRERANFLRRMRRRPKASGEYEELAFLKECPTIQEIKDALRDAADSSMGIVRLAALMDNLSAYHSPRLTGTRDDPGYSQYRTYRDECRGRTGGIRKFLEQDGYLLSRYSTLMRYKRIATLVREKTGILDYSCSNLLWGLEPTCPEVLSEELADDTTYVKLRALYASLEGKTFKEIETFLRQNERRG